MPPCSNTGAVARSHYGNAAPEGSRERDQSSSAYYRKMSVFNESCRVCEREVGPLPPFSSSLFRSPPYFIYPQPRLFFLLPEFQVLNSSSPFFFRLNIAVYHLRFLSFIRSSPLICHHPSLFYLSSHICLHQTLTAYITQFQT